MLSVHSIALLCSFCILCVAANSSASNIDKSKTLLTPKQTRTRTFSKSNQPFQRTPLSNLPSLKNDLLLLAATNTKTSRVPVWCMRQAGRHLPEFRALTNEGYDFFTMCQIPELAVEISLQPLRRYGVDAVIIFSDILVIPQAMGMEIKMVNGVGPVFTHPLDSPEDISKLGLDLHPNVEDKLGYVMDAINLARIEIQGQVPLIGFCGGPLSLLMFMVEGQSSKSFTKLKKWLYNYPNECHMILKSLANICVEFLVAQQCAGAQVLQVFESVGVEGLTRDQYYEFVLPYLSDIAERVKGACSDTPLIVFSKGTDYAFEKLAETKFDCLGVDFTSDPEDIRRRIAGSGKALQGNMDPCCIYGDNERIENEVEKMLHRFGSNGGYIANLGHGCLPDMDPEHVDVFIKSVQKKSLNTFGASDQ
jgi:uroporphyrinogen decarboxylase